MNYNQQYLYFKQAAENHKLIKHSDTEKHFSSFNPQQVLTGLREMLYPALLLEKPIVRNIDNGSDNILTQHSAAILVVIKVFDSDSLLIDQAYADTFAIAHDIKTKMLNDRKKANQQGVTEPRSLIKDLQVNSLSMQEVGPIFDSCYGWRLDFTIASVDNLTLQENNWLPGTETKFNWRQ